MGGGWDVSGFLANHRELVCNGPITLMLGAGFGAISESGASQVRGSRMTKRLGDSDRRAVDLLLDQAVDGGGDGNGGYVVHAQPALGPGVPGVQRVLSLLDLLPEEEPP